jgi:bifunctional DNase/RNase
LKMNNKRSPRPLTHDLIKSLLHVFDAQLQKVLIYDMVSDVFYSELYIKREDSTIVVDARTSDAVAIAVRSDCPIFIKSEILEIVGTVVEAEHEESKIEEKNVDVEDLSVEELDLLSLHALEELLEMCVSEEKYELAVTIRDAISRKQNV